MNKNKIALFARLLLGLILFIFGLNKFLMFMPALELTGKAGDFFTALIDTGYMFPLIALVEITAGIALLFNRFVPLGLLIMAPVTVNFIAFHLFLDLSPNMGAGILVLVLQVYLMFRYLPKYQTLLQPK